eukprot:g45341.t1
MAKQRSYFCLSRLHRGCGDSSDIFIPQTQMLQPGALLFPPLNICQKPLINIGSLKKFTNSISISRENLEKSQDISG